jgi:hypothetical protein
MFILCQLHRTDPRFEQYPVLPVLECPGYEPDADDPAVVEEGRP